jgi:hypothetical protein
MKSELRSQKPGVRTQFSGKSVRLACSTALLLISVFCLLTPSFAATHVTGTYNLGANPTVMATVNGTAEYGLVFVQRSKLVTYNNVQYGTRVAQGYLDASGQLNDGAGNLWLDLIPSTTSSPSDSYYVVTINIQGHVHSEIWVVPEVATIDTAAVRQAQPPFAAILTPFYQFIQQSGADLPQRLKLNLSGSGVSCADDAAQLSTDCSITGGGGGGSAPIASATTSGTVKTDSTVADPVVYLKSSTDSLLAGKANLSHTHVESDVTNLVTDLAGKVPTSRTISTTAPLAGGGSLASNLTLSMPAASGSQNGYLSSGDWTTFSGKENPLTFSSPLSRSVNTITCPTCELTGNKNAAGGYAGLTASSKLNASQGQEVWSVTDLTDYSGTSGSGATALKTTISTPSSGQCLTWSGSNWVNGSCSGGSSNHNLLSSTHPDTVPASPVLGDILYANSTPAWTKLAGNTATTKKYLSQAGNGSLSQAPAWAQVAAADISGLAAVAASGSASDLTTGTLPDAQVASITVVTTPGAAQTIQPTADVVGLTVECVASGSANCFQVKDNAGNTAFWVASDGTVNFGGSSSAWTGTPGSCNAAPTGKGQICFSSTGNRPVYGYNGGTNYNLLLASDALTLASAMFANQGTTTQVLHGNASGNPSWGSVVEGDFGFTNVTTANATTSAHGLLPKLDNNSAHYLDGTGAWSTPPGGSMTWPSSAGIALYSGSSSWSASIGWNTGTSTMTGNITGEAATATDLASYTSYSVFGSGNAVKAWITPTANGQCLMSDASNYATVTPSFQTCPSGSGSPGGSPGSVQYNNSGSFDGFGDWDGTTLSIGTPATYNFTIQANGSQSAAVTFIGPATQPSAGQLAIDGSGNISSVATTGSGSVVLANSPAITTPTISSIVNTGTLTLPTSTDTLVGRATTDTLTNKTLNAESTGNLITIPAKTFVAFASCSDGSTASLAVDAASAQTVACYGTNTKTGVWQAADADAVTFGLHLPGDFSGAIDASISFNSPDTSGTVIFNVATACVSTNGSTADDPSYNSSSAFTTVTLSTPANAAWNSNVTGITATGCTAGGWANFKVTRATDTATSRVNVKGVTLTMRRAM